MTKQSTIDIDLLDEDPDVGDLEDVLAASGDLEQAAGVGDGLLGVAHEGVLPVSETLGTSNCEILQITYMFKYYYIKYV